MPEVGEFKKGGLVASLFLFSIFLLFFFPLVWLLSPVWEPVVGPTGFNDQRLYSSSLISFFSLYVIIKSLFYKLSYGERWVVKRGSLNFKIFYCCYGLLLASSFHAQEPLRALATVGIFFGFFFFIVTVSDLLLEVPAKYKELVLTLPILFLAAIYSVSLIANFMYIYEERLPSGNLWVTFPNFPNPRLFNHIQVVVLPLLFGGVLYFYKSKYWLFFILAISTLFVWMVALFYSGGRGAILSILLAAAVTAVLSKGFRKITWLIGLVSAAAVIINILLDLSTKSSSNIGGGQYVQDLVARGSGGRIDLWLYSKRVIEAHPFLGVGAQHFPSLEYGLGSPHNLLLWLAAEFGIPLTCIAIFYLVKFFVWILSEVPRFSLEAGFRVWGLISVAIYSFFTGNVLSPLGQFFIATLVAMVFSDKKISFDVEKKSFSINLLLFIPVMVLASVVILDISFFSNQIALAENGRWIPRFWLNGYFHNY